MGNGDGANRTADWWSLKKFKQVMDKLSVKNVREILSKLLTVVLVMQLI